MNGFQSPNYTQTPNDLFDELLPVMGLAELKVVMCIVRHTFGYHKEEVKLSIRTIARLTGLTAKSVMEGAEQAEGHGLIERHIDGNKTTTWTAIVSVIPTTTPRDTKYHAGVIPTTTQLGVKESIKEKNKETPQNMPIDWYILHNLPVPEGTTDTTLQEKKATDSFEQTFGYGSLPWDSTTIWTKFRKFIVKVYAENPNAFTEYIAWRANGGKYDSMSPRKIRENPQMFMDTGWPNFLASSAMYPTSPKQPLNLDVPDAVPNYLPKPNIGRRTS